jgi:urease accessory protein
MRMGSITMMAMMATTIITAIAMTDLPENITLLRLMAWLSPAFPVGSFSYSHGLERAVHDGLVRDRESLEDWLRQLLEIGSGWNDAVLFAESWRRVGAEARLGEIAALAEALAGSRERHVEAMLQGAAFRVAARAWQHPIHGSLPAYCPYCVAVGAIAGASDIPLSSALAAFLQSFMTNLAQAGIRLGVIGQEGAVATIAALEPAILETASRAARSTLDDLGSATLLSEVTAMKHETQYSRLFRS